jgi:hypothetical protein
VTNQPAAVAAVKPPPETPAAGPPGAVAPGAVAPGAVAPSPVAPSPVRPAGPPSGSGPAPGAVSAPAKSQLSAPVRLEVIVYAEEKSRRLAFINGRKYVEGDTLLDNATIQEIQPNAVVIVEDGRRVVLRP